MEEFNTDKRILTDQYFTPVKSMGATKRVNVELQKLIDAILSSDCNFAEISQDFCSKYKSPESLRSTLNTKFLHDKIGLKAYIRNGIVYVKKVKEEY